jgi:hypothetical protein
MKKHLALAVLCLTALLAAFAGAAALTNPCPDTGGNPNGNFAGWFTVTKCEFASCQYQGNPYVAKLLTATCPLWCCPGDAKANQHTFYPSECNPGFGPPPSGNPCCNEVHGYQDNAPRCPLPVVIGPGEPN